MNLKATWAQALTGFLLPLLLIISIRLFLIEPFTIPSGSMIPTLLIHDHIFVNKLSFGVSFPWSQKLLIQWNKPQRGEVVVFRYPPTPHVFFVKRVVAVAGDEVELREGVIYVNGEAIEQTEQPQIQNDRFYYFKENQNGHEHLLRYSDREAANFPPTKIEEGHFFVVGDNRDQSSDSRVWGQVPESLAVGKVLFVWLSCEQTLASANYVCDPQSIRWERLFGGVH